MDNKTNPRILADFIKSRYANLIRYLPKARIWMVCQFGNLWQPADDLTPLYGPVSALFESKGSPNAYSTVLWQSATRILSTDPDLHAHIDDFDADPWLLNTPDGLYDLRDPSAPPIPVSPSHLISCSTAYAPVFTEDSRWHRFLHKILPDEKVRNYIRIAGAYTLTGLTTAQKFFYLHGPAATGKSTFTEVFLRVLGTYATKADMSTFLTRRSDGPVLYERSRLRGARYVLAGEPPRHAELETGFIKALVAGDAIMARDPYHSPFWFTPRAKLWVVANERVYAAPDDSGLWRRLVEIPFTTHIENPELGLLERLLSEEPGVVLGWFMEVCNPALPEQVFDPPAVVREQIDAYRQEVNPLTEFFDDGRLWREEGAFTKSSDLVESLNHWTERGRWSGKRLARLLRPFGFEPTIGWFADRAVRGYENLRVVGLPKTPREIGL